MQGLGRAVEFLATLAIIVAVGFWGRLMLSGLERHRAISAALLALAIFGTILALRRDYRGPSDGARLAVTRDIAYLAALMLVLWAVTAPARWVSGSALVMTEVAIIFDAFTRVVTRT
ncbi:MAG TPA: hypothetical protein VN905_15305 [Candidatus Binatia bacterium]|nr:hypothetical protein [Candidatus Binatia bacterium]